MQINLFVNSIVNTLAMFYGVSKILNIKLNLNNKKLYLSILFITIYTFFAHLITTSILRVLILFQLYNIFYAFLFKEYKMPFHRIIFASILEFITLIVAETVVAIFIGIISSLLSEATTINYFNDLAGYSVLLIHLLLNLNKRYSKFLSRILDFSSNSIDITAISIYLFIIILTTLYLIYFDLDLIIKYILVILSFAEYFYILVFIINNNKRKDEIQKELDLLLEVTTKYEQVINDIRTKGHENKNQLIVIKSLIGTDNNKAIKYIESMVKSNYVDDDELMMKVTNIPAGGLKGLIYYKLLTMKSNDIYCYLNSRKIDKKVFDELNLTTLQNFYKIVGVLVDNAIEAVSKYEKNDRMIAIQIYIEEDKIYFSISNEYKEKIDFEKLGSYKLTTKGEGHGYGLQLVKELVNSDSKIIHEMEVIGTLLIQRIIIDLNK